MNSMYKAFEQSSKLATEGTYLDFGDFRIKVAYAGETNPMYTKQVSNMHKVHGRAIFGGTMPEEKQRELLVRVYADTIVKNWEVKQKSETLFDGAVTAGDDDGTVWVQGIPARDGTLLPFTADNVYATLMALPMLYREVKAHADSAEYYKQSLIDGIVKN